MNKFKFLPLLAAGAAFVGCNDFDYGVTADTFKQKEYADQFKKDFGDVDPNHDWSMAGRYTVDVNLDGNVNGKLEIFTKSPSVKGSLFICSAIVENGKASFQFDAVKGATDFYARVVGKNGSNITDGYYSVEDMTLTVGNSAATRAEGTCPVTKGALWSAEVYGSRTMFRVREDAYKEMKTLSPQSYAELAKIPNDINIYSTKWIYGINDEIVNPESTETSGAQARYVKKAMFELATPQNLYYLNGVDLTQHNAGFTMEYLSNIFLKSDAVFKEKIDHTELANQGITQKDVIFNVSEDGPVTIDCIWRGTRRDDFFGYYYYTGTAPTEEELWEMPKFILLSDEESNIEQGSSPDIYKGWIQNDSRLTEYFDGTTWYAHGGMHCGTTGTKIRGRSIKLTYFGTDGNGTPTYTFPANTKIGFFLGGVHNTQHEIYFSDSKMSYALGGQYYAGAVDKGYGNRPMAATFKYDGNTFFGIGDYDGDADLNDLCFFVRGVDTPDEDLTHDDVKPKPMSWTLACEDLGGTFDYDFNDLVFDVVLTENADNATRTLTIEALAAGGTLDARLMYNGVDKGEVHGMFSESETSIPINVGSKGKTGKSASPITLATDISKDASVEDICKNIKVKVGNENDVVFISRESKNGIITPQMLILPGGWDWPTENTPITTVYPNFGKWIANYTYNTDWTAHREGSDFITSPKADAVIQVTEGGSGSGSGTDTGGGGSTFTPSGTTTYSGDALSEIVDGNMYTLPSSACQTSTSCTVKVTTVGTPYNGNSNYVQFKLYTTGRSGGPVQDFTEITNQYSTFDRSDVATVTVYEFHAVNSVFSDINSSGITLENKSGTISKIEIITE